MSPRRASPPSGASRSGSPYSPQTRRTSASSQSKPKKREQFSACGACRMRRVRCDLKDLPISSSGQHLPCSNCKERGLKCVDEFAEVKAVKLLRRGRRLQQVEAVYGKVSPEELSLRAVTPPPSVIPKLRPEFFDSPFFHRFHIQRPILEPLEFRERYVEFSKGNQDALPVPAQLIAMALVIWAAGFGVNEYGIEDTIESPAETRQRKELVNEMLHEMLYLVDIHGIMRKTSWDGIRLLLLLLPLTQEIQKPIDRMAMYEATLSQIHTLCNMASPSPASAQQGDYMDALVRARIFWYAHVLDGVTSGLRGGRLLFTDDDLPAFESTLPSRGDNSKACATYAFIYKYATIPIRVSSVCREIHGALTSAKARQSEDIIEDRILNVWNMLDRCWKELDDLRQLGTGDVVQPEDTERFIHGWQIFIFECHNVIREALKQRLVAQPSRDSFMPGAEPSSSRKIIRLHEKSKFKCHAVVRDVVSIIQRNLGTPFFQYDASLVRDGVFFAGFLLASESGTREDVDGCTQALGEMRWVYSRSEERIQTVRMVWESRMVQSRGHSRNLPANPADDPMNAMLTDDFSYVRRHQLQLRPLSVPPLVLPSASSAPSSAPQTACTEDGSWPPNISANSSRANSQPGSNPSHHSSPSIAGGSPPYMRSSPGGARADPSSSKGDLMASSSVALGAQSSFSRGVEPPDHSYYFSQYDYVGLDSADNNRPAQYFIPPVSFSNSSLAQHPAGGVLPSSSAATGGSPHFAPEGFYP